MNTSNIIIPLILFVVAGFLILRFVARIFIKLILIVILAVAAIYMFMQA
jgi:hypothetical protein